MAREHRQNAIQCLGDVLLGQTILSDNMKDSTVFSNSACNFPPLNAIIDVS